MTTKNKVITKSNIHHIFGCGDHVISYFGYPNSCATIFCEIRPNILKMVSGHQNVIQNLNERQWNPDGTQNHHNIIFIQRDTVECSAIYGQIDDQWCPVCVWDRHFNSLIPAKFEWHFRLVIFKLSYLFWNHPQMNVTGLYWWKVSIGSGYGLSPTGIKPLPEPMLTLDL